MGKICWSGWLSAAAIVAFVILAAGCQQAPPLVPTEVSSRVNADGREHTYDTAWQHIRALRGDIERGDWSGLDRDVLLITSQMERLETGRATGMTDQGTMRLVDEVTDEYAQKGERELESALNALSRELQLSFDAGDFERAKQLAIEIYVATMAISRQS